MAHKIDIAEVILSIKSDAQVGVENNDVNRISWHDGNPTNITNQQIIDKQTELQAVYDSNQYQRDRTDPRGTNIYPVIGDQLDMIYHDQVDGTTTFKDALKAIKDAHPKP